MKIETIYVKQYNASKAVNFKNDLFHKKSLPVLSIVQAIEGSYGIAIDNESEQNTGTMGAFIAPSEKTQHITHYLNPTTKVMRAHWIFLDIIINERYRFDSLFDFPILLPTEYQTEVNKIINYVSSNENICDNLSEIYKLVKILLEIASPKIGLDPLMNDISLYVNKHYKEKITAEQLSNQFSMSTTTLFRKFKAFFNKTPANYINDIRLSQSTVLLEITDLPIYSICEEVGFDDVFYFSKLFKSKYEVSPSIYRKQVIYKQIENATSGFDMI